MQVRGKIPPVPERKRDRVHYTLIPGQQDEKWPSWQMLRKHTNMWFKFIWIRRTNEGHTSYKYHGVAYIWQTAKQERSDIYAAWWMTLDFSSRYSEIFAPATVPPLVNFISRYLPKRLELSLMTVQAFPKASTRLLTSRIFSWSVRLLAWIKHYSS